MNNAARGNRTAEPSVQAVELITALNKEWAKKREHNLNALKRFVSVQVILKSDHKVQVAVAKQIISTLASLAKQAQANGKVRWFTQPGFPWGAIYFLSSQLKRRLRFDEHDLVEMFSHVVDIGFISASQFEFLGSLMSALERYAGEEALSPRLRTVLGSVLNNLLGKGKCRRLWEADAEDRKVAARIERMLDGPLDLN